MSGAPDKDKFEISLSMQTLETVATSMLQSLNKIQQTLNNMFANAGVTPYKLESAVSTNATSVTVLPTIVREINGYNLNATTYWLKVYDKASPPTVGTDIPVMTIPLIGSATVPPLNAPNLLAGLKLKLGLALAITLNPANTDATNAVTGIQVNIGYQ